MLAGHTAGDYREKPWLDPEPTRCSTSAGPCICRIAASAARAGEGARVSATSKPDRPLSQIQFALIAGVLAISAVLALVVLASVAGKHGTCPSETQVSRPGAS